MSPFLPFIVGDSVDYITPLLNQPNWNFKVSHFQTLFVLGIFLDNAFENCVLNFNLKRLGYTCISVHLNMTLCAVILLDYSYHTPLHIDLIRLQINDSIEKAVCQTLLLSSWVH